MASFFSDISVVPPWLWIAFSVGLLILLLVDLSLFGKSGHQVSRKASLIETGIWISLALGFNLWFGFTYGKELGVEFLTGYLLEKSLSIDNLFVILLIFSAFKIPALYQHRVLFYGVLGAIVMRAAFIMVGAQLMQNFHWVLYVFGGILILTAIQFLRKSDEHKDVRQSPVVRWLQKIIPIQEKLEGPHFFVIENNVRKATPLFLALVVIEFTDVVFAVDSIPAVFAVTQDAFVAFASNILAILGLRALYFVLADWIEKLRYLKPGLAAILGFIGAKMLLMDVFKIPSWISLLVVIAILTTAALCSWYVNRQEERQMQRQA